MAPVDNRRDRIYWAIANTTAATFVSLPLMWGLAKETSLKFMAGIGGTVVAINAVRLLDLHEQGAPVRSAWDAAGQMVSTAWIEEMALAILPPRIQQQEFAGSSGGEYYLPPPPLPAPQFQLAAPPPETENLPDRGDGRAAYGKMPGLSWYPSVLIYGIPGAGKTTFTEQEVEKRLAAGHEVIVLDPHVGYEQWEGCEVVGDGMDYKAIDAKILWFKNEVERRYKIRRTQKNPKFKPLTILTEEFTNWADRCKYSGEHFKTVNSDIRKVECYSLIVTHTRTLAGLGDAKGMASLRDESCLEVEILGDYDPTTERTTPRFEALVKMPGQALSDRTLVKIEKKSERALPVPNLQSGTPRTVTNPEPEKLGTPDGTRAEQFSGLLAEILAETAPAVFSVEFPLEHDDRVKLAKLVIAQNLGTEKTILLLWGVRRGGRNHHLYVEAKIMLDRLLEQIKKSGGEV